MDERYVVRIDMKEMKTGHYHRLFLTPSAMTIYCSEIRERFPDMPIVVTVVGASDAWSCPDCGFIDRPLAT